MSFHSRGELPNMTTRNIILSNSFPLGIDYIFISPLYLFYLSFIRLTGSAIVSSYPPRRTDIPARNKPLNRGILGNFAEYRGISERRSIAYTHSLHFKSRSREERIFSSRHPVLATSSKYTLPPTPHPPTLPSHPHRPLSTRGGCVAVHGGARGTGEDARRGFARTFRHVLERLRVPGLNKPLHFLAFQRRRRFSLPQVSRRVVGKDSNPLSPLSSSSPSPPSPLPRACTARPPSAHLRRRSPRRPPSYSLFTR